MSQYRRSEVTTGLFVAGAAVVFALFAFKVGRFDLMGLLKPEAVGRAHLLLQRQDPCRSDPRYGSAAGRSARSPVCKLVEMPSAEAESERGMKRLINRGGLRAHLPRVAAGSGHGAHRVGPRQLAGAALSGARSRPLADHRDTAADPSRPSLPEDLEIEITARRSASRSSWRWPNPSSTSSATCCGP